MATGASFNTDDILDHMIEDLIEDHGYTTFFVPGNDVLPGRTGTLGVYQSFHRPDLLIVGLEREACRETLRAFVDCLRAGVSLEADVRYHDYACLGYDVGPYELPGTWRETMFGRNLKHLGGSATPVLVLQFPDSHGRYPYEAEYEAEVGNDQLDLRDFDPSPAERPHDAEIVDFGPSELVVNF
jgi:hypothetical protein